MGPVRLRDVDEAQALLVNCKEWRRGEIPEERARELVY